MLSRDDRAEMREAVGELVHEMLDRNALSTDNVVSVLLTSTPDLVSDFPATGARLAGFTDIPLMSFSEIDVPGAPQRIVRVMMHVETDKPRAQIIHVYLRGAEVLRPDLTHAPQGERT